MVKEPKRSTTEYQENRRREGREEKRQKKLQDIQKRINKMAIEVLP